MSINKFLSIKHAAASFSAGKARLLSLILVFLLPALPAVTLAGQQSRQPQRIKTSRPVAQATRLTPSDEAFLEDLSRRTFQFFWEHSDPNTGLTLDRARTDGTQHPTGESHYNVASIASTGFALSGLCIAAERRWLTRKQAHERALNTLRFFADKVEHKNGWFYHWMDKATGERRWRSEISSIDTALLMGGVLTVKQYFRNDPEIVRLATKIYDRIDFRWMLNGDPSLLSHGWHPETGFIKSRWNDYSEHASLYILAIGSRTHPIRPEAWYAWRRDWIEYAGYKYLHSVPPLFIHQYPQAWVDLRGRRETRAPFVDYYENSAKATRAHKAFCLSLRNEFPTYTENIWGITASDSEKGYLAWGGPPRDPAIDGTVVPCAAGGSLMFAPDITVPALREMKQRYGDKIYGRYGFTDAFNPKTGWVNPDVIGIDLGMTLLSAENLRTGNVWRWFMRNREITRALDLIGLRKYKGRTRAGRMSAKQVSSPEGMNMIAGGKRVRESARRAAPGERSKKHSDPGGVAPQS